MKKWPEVSIIILNWNGWRDTIECLESLYGITYPNYVVVVVDNGSEDESVEKIKAWANGKIEVRSKFYEYNPMNKPMRYVEYDREEVETGKGEGKGTEENKEKKIQSSLSNRKLIIIKNEKNYGFAEGNNIGMRYALKTLNPDYILLLNNDTVVNKGFLVELIKVAESDEKIGIVGPKIFYYDEPQKIFSAGAKINFWTGRILLLGCNQVDTGQYEYIKVVSYVPGSALLVKDEVVEEIGLLHTKYFCYYEETEWCLRARKTGYEIIYVPRAKLWHRKSCGKKTLRELQLYYMTRNHFLFMKRNSTKLQFFSFLLYFFLTEFILVTGSLLILRKDPKLLKVFYKALYDGMKHYKGTYGVNRVA